MKAKGLIRQPLLGLLLLLVTTGCHSEKPTSPASDRTPHSYPAQGVIEQIAPDHHQVTIHHQDIPGYMMEMTMDFPVYDSGELAGLSPGDEITFTLVVDQDRDWVENLHRIGQAAPPSTNAMSMPMPDVATTRIKPGEEMPDVALIAENGRSIHFSDFRGKVVAFTFFFTRCPLPTYCPLMNRNFAAARQLLLATPHGPTNWQFLSISFDAAFDNSETLSSYAGFYRGNNADRWLFASASPATLAVLAPAVGLMIMGQDGAISHNLRTVVLDPRGRLYRQFNDNLWTPRQLTEAMVQAAEVPAAR
jgi:protein SCO1/2